MSGDQTHSKEIKLSCAKIMRNLSVATLYEESLRYEKGAKLAKSGALVAYSGEKTGRSPKDKRIVQESSSRDEIWWGNVNLPMDTHTFLVNRERAIDYLNCCERVYIFDGFAGWDPRYRLKIRVICSRPYHALFMHTMLIRPTVDELATFGEPDFTIINAGAFPANRLTTGMTSKTSIALNFASNELVILGSEYAGEMKKGVFTLMNYLMPKRGVLSMHCSATADRRNNSSALLFGLSGTGKTTLSADPHRLLIGDDEHCWSEQGIFNIEGGCYAKAIDLSASKEPDIFQALRFGAVLENVVLDPMTREVDYRNASITENTRGAYPIEFISNAKIPCLAGHPTDLIFLTCDAFGVLPPVSRLSTEQAMYHFISGYTAKVAGTEVGILEPSATFSPCFGGPFLVWHPAKYAALLAEKLAKFSSRVWLVNTGWTGGAYGSGKRMELSATRAIMDQIYSGALSQATTFKDPIFGLEMVSECAGVPNEILIPSKSWRDPAAYELAAKRLAALFIENFEKYRDATTTQVYHCNPVPV